MGHQDKHQKTKLLAVGRINVGPTHVTIGDHAIELVSHFEYFESWLNNEIINDEDMEPRIAMARRIQIICNGNSHLPTEIYLYKHD